MVTKLLIIGAGRRGEALLNIFKDHLDEYEIIGVVDINPAAKGMKLARSMNIPTSLSCEEILKDGNLPHTILNVSGDNMLQVKLQEIANKLGCELMGDITSRIFSHLLFTAKATQDMLLEKSTELENILNSLGEGVIMLDLNYKLSLVNPAAKKLFKLEDLKEGKDIREIKQLNALWEFIRKTNDSKESILTSELMYSRGEEPPIFILATSSKVKTDDEIIGIVVIMRDITKEKELEKAKEDLLANVSHELRTPLTSINNSVYLLESRSLGEINPSQQHILSIIKRNTDRLLGIINNLLDLSKIESGVIQELKMELNDLKDVIDSSIFGLKNLAERKQISIKTRLFGAMTYFSQEGLEHIMTNLLSNAIKFTPQGGKIEVSMSEEKDYYCIAVKDSGIGIPEDQIPRIFEKFAQLDNPLTPKSEGTGVGLPIVKFYVEAHKGKIWVKSKINSGSTFYFTIPKIHLYLKNILEDKINKGNLSCIRIKSETTDVTSLVKLANIIEEEVHNKDKIVCYPPFVLLFISFILPEDADKVLNRLKNKLEAQTNLNLEYRLFFYPQDAKDTNTFLEVLKTT